MDMMNVKKNKKPVKLRGIFIRYLSVFCVGIFLVAMLLVISFYMLLSKGIILPANYAEKQLPSVRKDIAASISVTPNLIPGLYKYAVYTTGGKMIAGNLQLGEAQNAWNITQMSNSGHSSIYFYNKIIRKNEVYVVRYTLMAQFSSPTLRRYLPNPELLIYIIFAFAFLTEALLLASSFGKTLTKKMSGLQKAMEKIQNQDLEFGIEFSGVLEIDNVLFAIDKMKNALGDSLKKQWDLEQTRREQISALAHDVKTPLTVVRGNAELLAETQLLREQKEYTDYIIESARQMERYVKSLIEISNTEMETVLYKENIDSKKYVKEICANINALASVKGIQVDFHIQNIPSVFAVDHDLLQRAIMNVVSNAVDYSPEQGKIIFSVESAENCILFSITDSGKGFSRDELMKVTEKFYTGDAGRSSKIHYGMGLYITKSIIERHNGKLLILNSPDTGGGRVIIEIPISL